ncbi:ribonuclease P protein component [Candidatus Gottesmanbacteria bacterium]|nr:ribonuclease P protein component [Candidatus Gottesmanbacteria bacterium]
MFPKANRLPAFEIRSVLRSKNRISSKELQLVFLKNSLGISRFAVIVSKSIDKRATARNRIKRLIRESIRHLLPQIASGWDCVIAARTNMSEHKQGEVENIIKDLLMKARLFS